MFYWIISIFFSIFILIFISKFVSIYINIWPSCAASWTRQACSSQILSICQCQPKYLQILRRPCCLSYMGACLCLSKLDFLEFTFLNNTHEQLHQMGIQHNASPNLLILYFTLSIKCLQQQAHTFVPFWFNSFNWGHYSWLLFAPFKLAWF